MDSWAIDKIAMNVFRLRDRLIGGNNPPDILLTNYVMLELILTRPYERKLIEAARGLSFLVLDELHTYRGRQGADVAMLLRRVKNILEADKLQLVGTSATLAGGGLPTMKKGADLTWIDLCEDWLARFCKAVNAKRVPLRQTGMSKRHG